MKFLRSKWTWGILVLIVLFGGYWYFSHRGKSAQQFVTVTRGSITQTVSVTGNTTPIRSVSLGFQNTGTVARVNYALGDRVRAGDVIAQLNTANLSAALAQAQASLAAQQATLAGLQAGAQPEDIAASQATLAQAQQDLDNLYAGISDAANSGFTKANDAVRVQLSSMFTNAETGQPQLSIVSSDSQSSVDAVSLRITASIELNTWQDSLATISAASSKEALAAELKSDLAHLTVIQNLLNTMAIVVNSSTNLSATTLASDKADVTAGQTEVNAAISSLNTISQNIATQQAAVSQAQAQLALKQAGSTPQAIAAQQAQVQQAQAGVAAAQANLQNAQIVAPIGGTITQLDAKVGQTASAGTPLVSILGTGGFEVDAGVSETDVGKLSIGDPVSMTLDAFSGETFTGKVFYIAPAETNTNGVITYLTKVSFDKPDARLKSGLTANLDIETSRKDNVLILPQYAILLNDQGTFVQVMQNNVATDTPVTLGIQDQNGNVEVVSGVTEGEQVLNIGLKTQ